MSMPGLTGVLGLLAGSRVEAEGDGVLAVPVSRAPFRLPDLEQTPDDDNRYEVIEGSLFVTPPPDVAHGWAAERLRGLLEPAASAAGLKVWTTAVGIDAGESVPIPDLVVFSRPSPSATRALGPGDVLLVAEIVSPPRWRMDHERKRRLYAAAGVQHYWIVDRDPVRVTLLRLAGGAYEVVGRAAGTEPLSVQEPFPITFRPADLLR
jgi:Uma2 family endonuclease